MPIIRINSELIPWVFGALFVAGFGYNLLVGWLESRGYHEGYTAILVVAGVGVTLLAVSLLSIGVAELMLGAFACSGFWMVIGSMWRHAKTREKSQKAKIDEATRLAE